MPLKNFGNPDPPLPSKKGIVIPGTNRAVLPITTTVLVGENEVGFMTSIDLRRTRRVERIREISGAEPGKIIEQAPHVEDYAATAEGLCLYTSSTQSRIQGSPNDAKKEDFTYILLGQYPFDVDIEVAPPYPEGTDGAGKTHTIKMLGCYMTSATTPFTLGNFIVTERIEFQPTALRIMLEGEEVETSER